MTKHIVAALFFSLAATTAPAQTLATYGTDSVSVPQFLQAYHKASGASRSPAALQQYLQLYIAAKLKVKEARARGYDTLPHLQAELDNLRQQLAPTYLKDEEAVNKLAAEALQRAQTDRKLSHLFIALAQDGLPNAEGARQKAAEAFSALQQGKPFEQVARQFSDDPGAKENGGKIGFITAFTLPYQLENLAYSLPVGAFSEPYLSKSGYHIFKIDSERPARGRLRIAQILLALPPDADAATDAVLKKRADSLYLRLQKGEDFNRLALQFSNEAIGGQAPITDVGIGQFDAVFEKEVFALEKDGNISAPFRTAHGYHIVKRLGHIPVEGDENALSWARSKVEDSPDRMAMAQAALAQKIKQQAGFRLTNFSKAELWAYSDSVLDGKREMKRLALAATTPLFTLGGTAVTVSDWIRFAQVHRYEGDGSRIKPWGEVWEAFVQSAALAHYQENLETYSEAFRNQLAEFTDGSLFFEIMQREVWNKAQGDTATLQAYYNRHQEKYRWQKSADAVLFYAADAGRARALQTAIAKNPKAWRTIAENNSAIADSGRFELAGLPGTVSGVLKSGTFTQPSLNAPDSSYAFAYVLKLHPQGAPRTFAEARPLVMADYQAQLDEEWVESLKQKYDVRIREEVLQQMLAGAAEKR